MAAVSVPSGRSLLGKISSALDERRKTRRGKPSVLTVTAAKVREHLSTVAALAAADFGAFQVHVPHLGSAPGWAMVAVSVVLLDFDIRN